MSRTLTSFFLLGAFQAQLRDGCSLAWLHLGERSPCPFLHARPPLPFWRTVGTFCVSLPNITSSSIQFHTLARGSPGSPPHSSMWKINIFLPATCFVITVSASPFSSLLGNSGFPGSVLAPSQLKHLTHRKLIGMKEDVEDRALFQVKNSNTWFSKGLCDIYIFYWPDSIHSFTLCDVLEFLGHLNSLWGQGGRIFVNGSDPEHMRAMIEAQDLKLRCLQSWVGIYLRKGPACEGDGVQTGDHMAI